MLALQSSMQSSGFSVMDADELFFINGGSSSNAGPSISSGPTGPTTEQKVKYVFARITAEIVFLGHDDAAKKDAWAKGVSGFRN